MASHQILRETHSCLTIHLTKCLEDSNFQQHPTSDNYFELNELSAKQTIKKYYVIFTNYFLQIILQNTYRYRLLKEFYCELPSTWIRFPETFIENIVENTLKLLSFEINKGYLLSL